MALVCWNISSKMQGIYPNLSGLIKDGLMTKVKEKSKKERGEREGEKKEKESRKKKSERKK